MYKKLKTETMKIFVLLVLTTFLLLGLSINLKYDFSQLHTSVFYDVLLYLPQTFIPILAIFVAFSITLILTGNFDIRLKFIWVLLIPCIYILEVVANYPNIWARDVYLHGQIWELDLYGNLRSIHYLYPKEYPCFFLTLYEIYKVLGINDIRIANLFVLYLALIFVLLLFIYVISYQVLRNRLLTFLTTLIAFSLLQFHNNEDTFVHANTRLYALVLVILIFYTILASKEKRIHFIVFLVATPVLTLSHALFQLVPLTTLLYLTIIDAIMSLRKDRQNFNSQSLLPYIFINLSIVLTWNIYNYYSYTVRTGITSFFNYVYHVIAWELIETYASITPRWLIPPIGVFLRNYYIATVILIALISLIHVCKNIFRNTLNYEKAATAAFSLAIISVFLSTFFTASLGNSINRMLLSLPIPLTVLFINEVSTALHKIVRNSLGKVITILFITYIVIAGYLLVHQTPVLQAKTVPLDNAALFISNNKGFDINVVATSPFNIYYSYFDPASRKITISLTKRVATTYTDIIEDLGSITENIIRISGIKVVDMRSVIIWAFKYNDLHQALNEFNIFVLTPLSRSCSLIYNNGGFEYVYL